MGYSYVYPPLKSDKGHLDHNDILTPTSHHSFPTSGHNDFSAPHIEDFPTNIGGDFHDPHINDEIPPNIPSHVGGVNEGFVPSNFFKDVPDHEQGFELPEENDFIEHNDFDLDAFDSEETIDIPTGLLDEDFKKEEPIQLTENDVDFANDPEEDFKVEQAVVINIC